MSAPRWTAALVTAVAVLGLAACSSNDNGGAIGGGPLSTRQLGPAGQLSAKVPPIVAARGVLRVGSDVGRAPLLFYGTGTTTPEGIEYQLLGAIARQLNLSVQVVDTPLVSLSSRLLSGKIDVLASGFVDLQAFQKQGIDFVDYLTGRTSVLVTNANPAKVSGPDNLCGRSVGVLVGTAQQLAAAQIQAACSARHQPPLALKAVGTHQGLIGLITGSQADAVLDDSVVATYTAQESVDPATVDVVGTAVDPVPYGIGVSRAQPGLRDAVQAALRAILADGEYDRALVQWGGEEAALRTASVNAGR